VLLLCLLTTLHTYRPTSTQRKDRRISTSMYTCTHI
jgi:hypothetical protein